MDSLFSRQPSGINTRDSSRDSSWGSSMQSYNLHRSISAPNSITNDDGFNINSKGKCKKPKRNALKEGLLSFISKIKWDDPSSSSSKKTGGHSHANGEIAHSSKPIEQEGILITPPMSPNRHESGFLEYLVNEKSAILKTLKDPKDFNEPCQDKTPHYDSPPTPGHSSNYPNIYVNTKLVSQVLDLDIPLAQSPIYEVTAETDQLLLNNACQRALNIPEILMTVLNCLDEDNLVPRELAQRRRKPLSLRHAILIYGDTPVAHQAWNKAQTEDKKWSYVMDNSTGSGLYNCLFVNRNWYTCTVEVLYKKLHFKTQKTWSSFVNNSLASSKSGSLQHTQFNSNCLVVHKITTAKQEEVDKIGKLIGGNLKWLEFYTCPSIVPTRDLLTSCQLKRLVLPGCSKVNNKTVALISQCCPNLEHLDLRACEQVSDWGLKQLSKNCRKLRLLNVGRTGHGELITTRGVKYIVRRTSVDTLGLAGCMIDDKAIWEIALRRGPHIERLSLNNCRLLTNESIPKILQYTTSLSVLELRGCVQITDMRTIIMFKRARERMGHPPLIEGCEVFELRMKEAEWMMEMDVSRSILADCLEWIYADDDDVEYDGDTSAAEEFEEFEDAVSTLSIDGPSVN